MVDFAPRPPTPIPELVEFRIAAASPEHRDLMRLVGRRVVNDYVPLQGESISVRELDPDKLSQVFSETYLGMRAEVLNKLRDGRLPRSGKLKNDKKNEKVRQALGEQVVHLLVHPQSRGILRYKSSRKDGLLGFFYFKEKEVGGQAADGGAPAPGSTAEPASVQAGESSSSSYNAGSANTTYETEAETGLERGFQEHRMPDFATKEGRDFIFRQLDGKTREKFHDEVIRMHNDPAYIDTSTEEIWSNVYQELGLHSES